MGYGGTAASVHPSPISSLSPPHTHTRLTHLGHLDASDCISDFKSTSTFRKKVSLGDLSFCMEEIGLKNNIQVVKGYASHTLSRCGQ